MTVKFNGGAILFSLNDTIAFSQDCCCSSNCSHCSSGKTIPSGYRIQVDFSHATTIPEGTTGCTGADICDDYNGSTFILDNLSNCIWTQATGIFCDNLTEVNFEIQSVAGPLTEYVMRVNDGGGTDGWFNLVGTGVEPCFDKFAMSPTYTDAGDVSADDACDWSGVTINVDIIE